MQGLKRHFNIIAKLPSALVPKNINLMLATFWGS
jgi:hypothetical protein